MTTITVTITDTEPALDEDGHYVCCSVIAVGAPTPALCGVTTAWDGEVADTVECRMCMILNDSDWCPLADDHRCQNSEAD